MKRIIFLLDLILITGYAFAQNADSQNIPPFRILKTDSTWFTTAGLNKHRPVMIIYFSPDCSHCQKLMKEMKPQLRKFESVQIIMITYIQPTMLRSVRDFSREFGLERYKNITVGTEGYTLLVQRYYQIAITPYIAVYNRMGKLIGSFTKPPSMKELIATVKNG